MSAITIVTLEEALRKEDNDEDVGDARDPQTDKREMKIINADSRQEKENAKTNKKQQTR